MVGKLIHIDENATVSSVDDRVKLVPEFAALLKKENGPKLMLFVYCVCDYYSPYFRIRSLIARFKVVTTDLFGSKYDPMKDDDVKEAISKYVELQAVPLFEQYDVQSKKLTEMTAAVNDIPIKETKKVGDETVEVDNLDMIMTKSDKLNKFGLSLQKLELEIEKHIKKVGEESPIVKSISLIEQKLKKKQLAEMGIKT